MLDQTISHYRITERLGAGGMGVVYKAVDLTLERTVALKFLPQEAAPSENDREYLLREARVASALDHPNIGVIHGLEESEDHQLFIVMGYYEGETLAQKIGRGIVSVRDSLDYAIQIAGGLSAAHARGLVHRDIKPSNIIITSHDVAKIVDFGLARAVATASATQSVSNTGTLPYMAPEQILGEVVDQRADVWALGVVIVQMLTGSHPFLRPNTAAMTFAILNQPPSALDAVPAPLQPIIYRALSKKAAQRYASAEQMRKDLETARAEITATPMPLEEPTVTRAITPRELKQYVENASTPRWSAAPRLGRSRRLLFAGLGVVLAAAAVFSLPRVRAVLFESAYAGTEKHIAVLPFENKSNDPDSELISSGLMDSVTNRLSNLDAAQQSLWVVPASVVRSRHVRDPASAYRTLGATIVVEGGLERRGQNVVLTLNLVDAKRLRQIGSEEIEDHTGDLAAIEDDAIFKLARLLKAKIPETGLAQPGSVNASAYESYLKALGYLQRYDKPGNLDRAIAALNAATQRDPRFALGYATLGEAFRLKFQMDNHPPYLSDAAKNAEKAVELNDHLPAPHATLGEINITLGKTDLALQEFQRALDLAPRDADAAIGLAIAYEYMNRLAESEATYKRAIALRPDYWDGYTALANFYYRQNRLQDAISQYKRVIELTPDNAEGYSNLGAAYMALNDAASNVLAESAFRKSIQLGPTYVPYTNLGILYLNERRYAEAAQEARKALDYNDKDWQSWDTLLAAYTWMKDVENMRTTRAKTLHLLEQYAATNPKSSTAQSRLSNFYAEDEQREKALTVANTALALNPNDATVLGDLAATYEILGDRRKALQYAEQSLKNGGTLADLQRRPSLTNLLASPSFRSNGKH
jgi:serine/threonine protein kinase/tetratricopeptide (TPR) repeat protein